MPQRGARIPVLLGTVKVKVTQGETSTYKTVKVISRLLPDVAEALEFQEINQDDLEGAIKEAPSGEVIQYYRRGSLFDSELILIRSAKTPGNRNKTYRIPIPSYYPIYKAIDDFRGRGDVIALKKKGGHTYVIPEQEEN